MKHLYFLLFPLLLLLAESLSASENDSLSTSFKNPPREYRPRVWWHWMNGNITRDGIRKDIEWMDKSGIAGFHIFDAGFDTPQIVDERLVYMDEGWRREFNFALDLADSLGMEVSITSSPGWSITGGPWVKEEDAMKKLTWSETIINGAGKFRDTLACPSDISGPYLNHRRYKNRPDFHKFYRDVAVIAVRLNENDLTMEEMGARFSTSDGSCPDGLHDGIMDNTVTVAPGPEGYAWVLIELDTQRMIKSYLEGVDNKGKWDYNRRLQCSDDGITFRDITPRDPEAPTVVNIFDIPPTTARYFRFCGAPGMPLLYSELALYGVTKVNAATEKAGFFTSFSLRGFYPTPAAEDAATEVIDLTGKYRDGVLDWKVPAGKWKIYRFGYSLTGKCNGPATPEATGLEVDKLDADAVRRYWRQYLDMYQAASHGRLGTVITNLMIDSYESRCQNWTGAMVDEFAARRGYSLIPWLPALAGEVIYSADKTERFLSDWRRTLEELMAEGHYDAADDILKEYGLTRHTEAQEYSRVYNADGMEVRRNADVPMAAFWMREFYSSYPCEEADMREAASVAHIYGQNTVAGESFTTNGEDPDGYGRRRAWTQHPGNLKSAADAAMASGLNRFIIHSTVHQPVDDKFPGLTLNKYGMAFNRHSTWASETRTWTDYLSRSSYLLSQGRYAADIAFLYGELTNTAARFKYERPPVPAGYSYDFVNASTVRNMLKTEDNQLVTDSGMSYRVLMIDREYRHMSVSVLSRLAEFARTGVIICGEEPAGSLGMTDDEDEFVSLVKDIWHSGRMNVLSLSQLDESLLSAGIPPDIEYLNPTGADIRFVHRHLDDGELYWIANINPDYRRLDVSFNVSGLKPVIMHPDDGSVEETSYRMVDGRTIVTLNLVPDDAQFVYFCEPTDISKQAVPSHQKCTSFTVSGPWDVSFQTGRGAPESVRMDELSLLNESTNPGIRYFSGTAVFSTSFTMPSQKAAQKFRISLGNVHNMARIFLNGQDAGLVWKEPYSTDITDFLKAGENTLEIHVTNTWHNRIIGDLQPDSSDKITWTSYSFYDADSPLRESGLEGPVIISQYWYPL